MEKEEMGRWRKGRENKGRGMEGKDGERE